MTDGQFSGATRDPVALLEQLLGHVASMRRDISELKQDVSELKQDMADLRGGVDGLEHRFNGLQGEVSSLRTEVTAVRTELSALRADVTETRLDLRRFLSNVDQDQAAFKTHLENAIERKTWLLAERLREESQGRHTDLERRIATLEAAERQRQEGKGA